MRHFHGDEIILLYRHFPDDLLRNRDVIDLIVHVNCGVIEFYLLALSIRGHGQ